MADSGLFIGWGDIRTGRTAASNRVFAEALAYWPTLVGEHEKCREIATKSAEAIEVSRA